MSSKKQLFSKLGFGRKKDSNASLSPAHQSANQQQYGYQESKQQNDYTNGTNNGNVNGNNNYYQNGNQLQSQSQTQNQNNYSQQIHNSASVHNKNHSNGQASQLQQSQQSQQSQASQSQTQQSQTHHSHKSKSSNGKKKRKHTSERMTIETSALSPEMSQEDVAKLLKLDNMPNYAIDDRGYIEFSRGLFIHQRYIILETLGRGTFSKVFESIDVVDKIKVAVKVIRNSHRYIEAAKTELRVLQHITNADDGKSCCIHLRSHFHWNKHPVLVFKLYGPSIYTVMAKNHYRPFPDNIVKSLTIQICTAIQFMHHLGIIFTDLKPENMVFVDGRTQMIINSSGKQEFIPIDPRIKLVDFGSAVYEPVFDPNNPKTHKFKNGYNYLIQTRHYRAPEVVLEMPWKRQVDIWSIGCVILEFLYGSMVFNTHCAIDHLNQMQKMIGKIPNSLIQQASDKAYDELFTNDGKLNLENAKVSRAQARPLKSYFNMENFEHQALYDLVQRTLRWEAKDRINADQILRHAYFQINLQQAQAQAQSQQQQQQQGQNGYAHQYSQSYSQAQGQQHQHQKVISSPRNGYVQAPNQAAPQIPSQQAQQAQQMMTQEQYNNYLRQQQAQQAQMNNSNGNGQIAQQPYITQ